MKKTFWLLIVLINCTGAIAQALLTPFEKSGGKETATYFETIDFYKRLAVKNKQLRIMKFATTDAGYPLYLILFAANGNFKPAHWVAKNKVVVLINNGIHPGEPDGIDATMMLLRDMCSGKIKAAANVVLGIIPMYNIGGALNRNNYSRVNQDGPKSYGFRGNAQNLNLNRDFTKLDSKDAKAFTKIFHYLNPDILIDNHVSDGADYQHTMTLITTQHNKLGGAIGKFLHNEFEPAIYKSMEQQKWSMTPYVDFYGSTPEKGWAAFYDPPMFSTGYAALFQTISFMPETHMLKPFADRVRSNYALMQTIAEVTSKQSQKLKANRLEAIEQLKEQKRFPLSWKADTSTYDIIRFKGYQALYKHSNVTGFERLYYDRNKPFEKDVKFFNSFTGEKFVDAPIAYLVPQGWWGVMDNLKLNGVKVKRLKHDTLINVEVYRIEDYKSAIAPFEKHHRNSNVTVSKKDQNLEFFKGDYVIYCNQPAKRYLIEMLEPTSDHGFFAWNYFDAILEQKEGYSDYRWEDVAAEYLVKHPEVKQQMDERKKTDTSFAASPKAQLNFVYKNSPYYEPEHMRYPVFRLK